MEQEDRWKSCFSLEEKNEKGASKLCAKTVTQKKSFNIWCVLSQERKLLRHLERQKDDECVFQMLGSKVTQP